MTDCKVGNVVAVAARVYRATDPPVVQLLPYWGTLSRLPSVARQDVHSPPPPCTTAMA